MKNRKGRDKAIFVNTTILLLGIVLILLGVLYKSNEIAFNILLNVGVSFLSSSVVVLVAFLIDAPARVVDLYGEWKIDAIYETRSQMNAFAADHLQTTKNCYDIVGFGLKTLRETKGDVLEQKYAAGLKIRILTMNPDSIFLSQREKDENKREGEIRETIINLIKWVNRVVDKYPASRGSIDIKFYDAIPLDHYCRQDEVIFVGGHQYGKESQQSIAYQFSHPGKGFEMYALYFENLWHDNSFAKPCKEDQTLWMKC